MPGRTPRIIAGATLKLYLNNRILGIVTSFSFRASTGRRALRGIDNADAYEIAEGAAVITGSMGVLRLRSDGGLEGYGLIAQHDKLSLEKYITISVVERFTDKVVFQTDRALVLDQQWTVDGKGIMTGTIAFEAIGWANDF